MSDSQSVGGSAGDRSCVLNAASSQEVEPACLWESDNPANGAAAAPHKLLSIIHCHPSALLAGLNVSAERRFQTHLGTLNQPC